MIGLGVAYVAILVMALIPILWGSYLSIDQRHKVKNQMKNELKTTNKQIENHENRLNLCQQKMHGNFLLLDLLFYLDFICYLSFLTKNT
jgi:hypothetical protein